MATVPPIQVPVELVSTTPVNRWAPVISLFEKAGSQAIQAAIAVVLLAGTIDATVGQKAGIVLLATMFTLLANGVPALQVPEDLPFVVQLILRVVRSFVAAFLAPIAAQLPVIGLGAFSLWYAAALAGAVAGLTVIKGALAGQFVGADTPALLPERFDLAA